LGVFFHIDNALCSIAFGTHTKTAELIEMPFGMMIEVGLRNSVLRGGDDPEEEGAVLLKTLPDKPNITNNCELNWSMQQHMTGVDT